MFSACRHFLVPPNPGGMYSSGGEKERVKGESSEDVMNGALEPRDLSGEAVEVRQRLPFFN